MLIGTCSSMRCDATIWPVGRRMKISELTVLVLESAGDEDHRVGDKMQEPR